MGRDENVRAHRYCRVLAATRIGSGAIVNLHPRIVASLPGKGADRERVREVRRRQADGLPSRAHLADAADVAQGGREGSKALCHQMLRGAID